MIFKRGRENLLAASAPIKEPAASGIGGIEINPLPVNIIANPFKPKIKKMRPKINLAPSASFVFIDTSVYVNRLILSHKEFFPDDKKTHRQDEKTKTFFKFLPGNIMI